MGPTTDSRTTKSAMAALAPALALVFALGGCGGASAGSSSTSTHTTASGRTGASPRVPGHLPGGGDRLQSPAVRRALAQFAACMRAHGVALAPPNTSGKGPVFDTRGLDPQGAKFRHAEAACRADLLRAFRAHPGARPAPRAPLGGSSPRRRF